MKPFTEYRPTDAGRAAFTLDAFADHLAFVPEAPAGRGWRIWDNQRWREDSAGLLRHWISTELAQRAIEDAVRYVPSDSKERRAAAVSAALKLGDAHKIASLLSIAQTDPRIIVPIDRWDSDPWLAGVQNGVVDLRKGKHRAAKRSDLITKELGAHFDAHAQAPTWLRFVAEILPDDGASYVQEVMGYSLTGATAEQCFWFFHGCGANGKSRLVDAWQELLGGYACRAAERLVAESDRGDVPEKELAMLPGVRLLIGTETREGMRLREGTVKDLTGGDSVSARHLYGMPFTFRPCSKIVLMGNHRPVIIGADGGIWRRVKLVHFPTVIPEERRDPHLGDKLRGELAGILNWCLEGLGRWCQRGKLAEPAEVTNAGREYREDEDTLGGFIAEHIQPAAPTYLEPKTTVYKRFQEFAETQGLRHVPTQKAFTRRLAERPGFSLDAGRRHWQGISLITIKP